MGRESNWLDSKQLTCWVVLNLFSFGCLEVES